jgi:23S rRNA pseudouridine2605 synthase
VTRLIRVAYGPFQLGNLPASEVEEMSGKVLKEQLGIVSHSKTERERAHRGRQA